MTLKKAIAFLLSLILAFALSVVLYYFFPKKAYAATEWKWERFGADPYASSREKAMETRESAFKKLGLPSDAIASLMNATESPGEKGTLKNGDKLAAMLSHRGDVVRKNVIVAVPPPEKGVEFVAIIEEWRFEHNKISYSLVLPEVCFNWSLRVLPMDVSRSLCVELSFNAPVGGKVRWGIASADGPLTPSECNAQKQGDGDWKAWHGKCDDCAGALGYIREILGAKTEIEHKFLYSVTAQSQTLRFSEAVMRDVVYICLEYPDGKRTCGVYMRQQDWNKRRSVAIPDSLWIVDTKCPQ